MDLNRYEKTLKDIYSIVESMTIEGLKIVPIGYQGTETTNEYIRFNPVIGENNTELNLRGILYFDIYTKIGEGPTRAYKIADIIEKYFLGNTVNLNTGNSVTQFIKQSNLVVKGEAKNPAFLQTLYQIQFNNFRKDS